MYKNLTKEDHYYSDNEDINIDKLSEKKTPKVEQKETYFIIRFKSTFNV